MYKTPCKSTFYKAFSFIGLKNNKIKALQLSLQTKLYQLINQTLFYYDFLPTYEKDSPFYGCFSAFDYFMYEISAKEQLRHH